MNCPVCGSDSYAEATLCKSCGVYVMNKPSDDAASYPSDYIRIGIMT